MPRRYPPRSRSRCESPAAGPMLDTAEPATVPTGSKTPPQQRGGEPLSDARILTCGTDMSLPAPIPVRWDTVVLAGDSQGFAPCTFGSHDPSSIANSARVPVLGRRHELPRSGEYAVRPSIALGRVGAWPDGSPVRLLLAVRPAIAELRKLACRSDRRTFAQRAADRPASGEMFDKNFAQATTALRVRLRLEKDDAVAGVILATIGRIRYRDDAARDEVETFLANAATVKSPAASASWASQKVSSR